MRILGEVVSEPHAPNTMEFWFLVKESVNKNQFVKVNNLVARVIEIFNENDIYRNLQQISQVMKRNNRFSDFVKREEYSYTLAKAEILDSLDGSYVKPPSPGDVVEEISNEELSKFLGLEEGELMIGTLEFHELPIRLDVERLLKKHLAILAMSGAGKSHLASVIMEELLKLENKPIIIVFDVHGEYIGFAKDSNFAKDVLLIDRSQLKVPVWGLSVYDFSNLFPEISGPQRRLLDDAISELKDSIYDLEDIIKVVEEKDAKANTKDSLLGKLKYMQRFYSLSKEEYPTTNLLNNYGLVIIDLSEILDVEEKQLIVYYLMKKLFEARRMKQVKPVVFFVEEAHQFAPQRSEVSTITKNIIEKIAREGRKFNTSIVLISQRPVNLSTTALSQCNTQIIMRITNPNDLDQVSKSSEKISREFINQLPGLKVGQALIVGEAVDYPILIRVRPRESRKEEKWLSFKEELKAFSKPKEELML